MPDAAADSLARYVTVTGTRQDRFVEFRFAVGDPDLSLDLVMRLLAFQQFCAREGAVVQMADGPTEAAFRRLGAERAA